MNLPTKEEIKASIEAMSPDERKQMVNDLCSGVDKFAKAIVANKDAIWEAAMARRPGLN